MRALLLGLPIFALAASAVSCLGLPVDRCELGAVGSTRALQTVGASLALELGGLVEEERARAEVERGRVARVAARGGASRARAAATAEPKGQLGAGAASGDDEEELAADWGVEPDAAVDEAELGPVAEPGQRAPAADEGSAPAPSARRSRHEPDPGDRDALLASIARETWIYAEPKKRARRIGYLRAGSVVQRGAEPVAGPGCKGGWYRIAPRGYVCAERTATLDAYHPVVEASRTRPKLDGLPYDYVMSRMPTPTLYARLPSEEEQRRAEPDLGHFTRKHAATQRDPSYVPLPEPGALPPALLYGGSLPGLADDKPRSPSAVVLGQARIRSGYALLAQFDHEGRRFGLTTELSLIPLDRTRWVPPSSFHGLALDPQTPLPVAFVMKRHANRYAEVQGGGMSQGAKLAFREAVALTGRSAKGGSYLEARDGSWVRAEDVRVIEPMQRQPAWANGQRRWIDVSILKQSLVAYEGTRPVYVTLVSTGRDGLGDPKKTHSTIQGAFLVHTKHLTVTMDGDDDGDEFDLRDVPFVQYFTEGYALHAAYWHDDFGTPRSHGCINLAPRDAAWLFGWTTPDVPEGWHASLSLKHGTLVHTHP